MAMMSAKSQYRIIGDFLRGDIYYFGHDLSGRDCRTVTISNRHGQRTRNRDIQFEYFTINHNTNIIYYVYVHFMTGKCPICTLDCTKTVISDANIAIYRDNFFQTGKNLPVTCYLTNKSVFSHVLRF